MVWQDERKGGRLLIRVAPFGTLSSKVRNQVEAEGEYLGRFLEVDSVRTSFAAPRKDDQN